MKQARKSLRSIQRRIHAEKRYEQYDRIMVASPRDQKLFHSLVRQQRDRQPNPEHMVFNETVISGDDILDAWASYFKGLATPLSDCNFNEEDKEHVEWKIMVIEFVLNHMRDKCQLLLVDGALICAQLKTMKNGKAADQYGMAAEHLKYAGPVTIKAITNIINRIIADGTIPGSLKAGLITPVYKNKSSNKNPTNYRRITVTSILGKVLGKILVEPTKRILKPQLNTLQRGFCDNASSMITAFLMSEAISEAKDKGQLLFCSFLDAFKAFDVVWHDGMLLDLYNLGISGDL